MHPPPAAPPGDVSPRRLSDPQWFALAWYGQTIERLAARKGLARVVPESARAAVLGAFPGLESGHLVAVTPELLAAGSELAGVPVAGGPCIGDCSAFPTLEALYDSVVPMLVGRVTGGPVVLYLGDEEERLERGGEGRWGKLAERFEGWLHALAETVGCARLHVVRTGTAGHAEALASAGRAAGAVEVGALDRCFSLVDEPPGDERAGGAESGKRAPEETRARDARERSREVARRVVEAHLPAVVHSHAGRAAGAPADAGGRVLPQGAAGGRILPQGAAGGRILVVENLQQAGVVAIARELALPGGGTVHYAAHWPAPALSGSGRMYRSGTLDKAPAWELASAAAGEIPGIHPYAQEFFACWTTPELRAELSARAREAWGA